MGQPIVVDCGVEAGHTLMTPLYAIQDSSWYGYCGQIVWDPQHNLEGIVEDAASETIWSQLHVVEHLTWPLF